VRTGEISLQDWWRFSVLNSPRIYLFRHRMRMSNSISNRSLTPPLQEFLHDLRCDHEAVRGRRPHLDIRVGGGAGRALVEHWASCTFCSHSASCPTARRAGRPSGPTGGTVNRGEWVTCENRSATRDEKRYPPPYTDSLFEVRAAAAMSPKLSYTDPKFKMDNWQCITLIFYCTILVN